jgi:hypothetical protein
MTFDRKSFINHWLTIGFRLKVIRSNFIRSKYNKMFFYELFDQTAFDEVNSIIWIRSIQFNFDHMVWSSNFFSNQNYILLRFKRAKNFVFEFKYA